jgi:hypothetical protein
MGKSSLTLDRLVTTESDKYERNKKLTLALDSRQGLLLHELVPLFPLAIWFPLQSLNPDHGTPCGPFVVAEWRMMVLVRGLSTCPSKQGAPRLVGH